MEGFWIGIASGIATSILIYAFRYYIGFIVNTIFYKVYPNVSGEYNIYSYELEETNYGVGDDQNKPSHSDNEEMLEWLKATEDEPFYRATMKQFAFQIRGEIRLLESGNVTMAYKIRGRVTPSRIVLMSYEGKTPEHHNFGTILLKITPTGIILRGASNFLCANCGDVGSDYVFFEKVG